LYFIRKIYGPSPRQVVGDALCVFVRRFIRKGKPALDAAIAGVSVEEQNLKKHYCREGALR
jgi:hypothetical protein